MGDNEPIDFNAKREEHSETRRRIRYDRTLHSIAADEMLEYDKKQQLKNAHTKLYEEGPGAEERMRREAESVTAADRERWGSDAGSHILSPINGGEFVPVRDLEPAAPLMFPYRPDGSRPADYPIALWELKLVENRGVKTISEAAKMLKVSPQRLLKKLRNKHFRPWCNYFDDDTKPNWKPKTKSSATKPNAASRLTIQARMIIEGEEVALTLPHGWCVSSCFDDPDDGRAVIIVKRL